MKKIILSMGAGLIDHFIHVRNILSAPFCPYHFVHIILSIPFCPRTDQPQCASETIFSGGPRTETKFTKWFVSLKRLRTAGIGLLRSDKTSVNELGHPA